MTPLSRRDIVGQRQCALAGAPSHWPTIADGASDALLGSPGRAVRKLKVIVTGGHPGDPEYGCGGTIARYTDLGHEVALLYLNRGEWPPGDAGLARVAEARKACEILQGPAALRRAVQQRGGR